MRMPHDPRRRVIARRLRRYLALLAEQFTTPSHELLERAEALATHGEPPKRGNAGLNMGSRCDRYSPRRLAELQALGLQ
jgi:hypothetical protein